MLSQIDANQVLRHIANHYARGNGEEVKRILDNLYHLTRARDGEITEEEGDQRAEAAKIKLLTELGLIKRFPEIQRVDKPPQA